MKHHQQLAILLLLIVCQSATCMAAGLPSIYRNNFVVGAQFYDYQNYHDIPYFHGGLDLCAPAGTEVFTPVGGTLSINDYKITATLKPHRFSYQRTTFRKGMKSNTRYLEIAITDQESNLWMFRHVDASSIPDAIFAAAEKGHPVAANTMIGKVAPWHQPVLPERQKYDHIHLEILASDGTYLNPADFVATDKDYYPPVIHRIYAVNRDNNTAIDLTLNTATISGKIDLVAAVTDRMNRSAYQHSVYAATWRLERLETDGSVSSQIDEQQVFRFDRLPFIGDRVQLSDVIYKDSLQTRQGRVRANGADGPRHFLINLSCGTVDTGYSAKNCLDTGRLASGRYRLWLKVSDQTGNHRERACTLFIKN